MIIGSFVMMFYPKESYPLIILIFAFYFIIKGIRSIVYYLTMARYMVGGRESLYIGVIWLDFGMVTGSLAGVPYYFVLMYLVAIHGFLGVILILRTIEARRSGSSSWRLKLMHGIVDIAMAFICIVFIRKPDVTVIIYAVGLMYSALMRIISACRRTALIVIE